MDREIEIAREVQEGLFPQHFPPVKGIEYVGFCRPALGVGGDYCDFVKVESSSASPWETSPARASRRALLMASLQASLRAQAISAPVDLATLMSRLNELIYENSPRQPLRDLLYGQYDPATRSLHYVNAGHNAPHGLSSTRGGIDLLRVDGGGPVIGLLPAAAYQQFAIDLRPGDLLVGYTDG